MWVCLCVATLQLESFIAHEILSSKFSLHVVSSINRYYVKINTKQKPNKTKNSTNVMLAFGKHYICILHTKWTDFVNWLVTWLCQTVSIHSERVCVCVSAHSRAVCIFFFCAVICLSSAEWAYCLLYLILVAQKNISFTHSALTDSRCYYPWIWCCVFYIRSKLSDCVCAVCVCFLYYYYYFVFARLMQCHTIHISVELIFLHPIETTSYNV